MVKRAMRLVSGVAGVAGLAVAPPALAQDLSTLKLNIIPGGNLDLIAVISRLLQEVLLVLGIIAFFYLVYAGYTYLTGGGDDTKAKAARIMIVNVVIGILIIAFSFVILQFVIEKTRDVSTGAGSGRNDATVPRPRR